MCLWPRRYVASSRMVTPMIRCPCGDPAGSGQPCSALAPCPYAQGRIEALWTEYDPLEEALKTEPRRPSESSVEHEGLRERIAEAIFLSDEAGRLWPDDADDEDQREYRANADAVLAVLSPQEET